MAKPRSKFSRRARAPSASNPEIQRALSIKARKKRFSSWAFEDALDWNDQDLDQSCSSLGKNGQICNRTCGNIDCPNYSVLLDPYYEPSPNTLLVRGLPKDTSGESSQIEDLHKVPLATPTGVKLVAAQVYPINASEALVTFGDSESFRVALEARILRRDTYLYSVHVLPVTSKTLFDRLQEMDMWDDMVEDSDSDNPIVAAALIPGLRRSDFTCSVDVGVSRAFKVDDSTAARMRAILDC